MNNIQKPHKAIYLGLLIILFVLIAMVLLIPFPKFKKTSISPTPNPINIPTPTEMLIKKPVTSPKPVLVTPTGTGGMEDIPKSVSDSATQKQDLKKRLPLKEQDFSIDFDYTKDMFIVTFSNKNIDSINKFQQWLKTQYSSLSIDKFDFK